MGIHGLLPFLKNASRPANVKEFSGCTVAVDAYCWLHKGAFSCADKLVKGEKTDGYVFYCMKMVNCLVSCGLKPILVFDGCRLPSKAVTETKRREQREKYRKLAKEFLREGKLKEARESFQRCVDVTPEMALDVIQALRKKCIDYIVAPYEADAQLAYLATTGIAQLVITEDSDLMLFGCERVLYKMDTGGHGVLVEKIRLPLCMLGKAENFTFDKFRHMCILSGCDYLPSLPGIGLGKACKFFSKVTNPDLKTVLPKLPVYLKMSSLTVSQEYITKFIQADNTFLYQLVFDPLTRTLLPLIPYPPDCDPRSLTYAGKYLDESLALEVALGNINVNTMKPMDSYSPDTPRQSVGWESSPVGSSIWDKGYKKGAVIEPGDLTTVHASTRGKEVTVRTPSAFITRADYKRSPLSSSENTDSPPRKKTKMALDPEDEDQLFSLLMEEEENSPPSTPARGSLPATTTKPPPPTPVRDVKSRFFHIKTTPSSKVYPSIEHGNSDVIPTSHSPSDIITLSSPSPSETTPHSHHQAPRHTPSSTAVTPRNKGPSPPAPCETPKRREIFAEFGFAKKPVICSPASLASFKPVLPARTSPVFNRRNPFAKMSVVKIEIEKSELRCEDDDVSGREEEHRTTNFCQFSAPVRRANPFGRNSLTNNKESAKNQSISSEENLSETENGEEGFIETPSRTLSMSGFEGGKLKHDISPSAVKSRVGDTPNTKIKPRVIETPSRNFGKLSLSSPQVKSNKIDQKWWPQGSDTHQAANDELMSEDESLSSSMKGFETPHTSQSSLWSMDGETFSISQRSSPRNDGVDEDVFLELGGAGDSRVSVGDDLCDGDDDDDLVVVSCDVAPAERRQAAKDWVIKTTQNIKGPAIVSKKSQGKTAGNRTNGRGCKRPGLSRKPSTEQGKQPSIKDALNKFAFNKRAQQL